MARRVDRDDWRIWVANFWLGVDGLAFFVWRDVRHVAWFVIPALIACQGLMYGYYRRECIPRLERIQADSEELAALYDHLFRFAIMIPACIAICTWSLL